MNRLSKPLGSSDNRGVACIAAVQSFWDRGGAFLILGQVTRAKSALPQ
jgi:hypothetical protein